MAGLHLIKKGYKVLVVDKNIKRSNDQRTLAVNANSKDFLSSLGIWNKLKNKPQKINKIVQEEMAIRSKLIESVGQRIITQLKSKNRKWRKRQKENLW